jgi:hypothetical protein
MRSPGGWALGHADPTDTPALQDRAIHTVGGSYCLCARAPFCGGALSADWASCSPACKPCRVLAPPTHRAGDPSNEAEP